MKHSCIKRHEVPSLLITSNHSIKLLAKCLSIICSAEFHLLIKINLFLNLFLKPFVFACTICACFHTTKKSLMK